MITRSQMRWIFLSLVALRLIVGFHFFTEGKKKIDQGDWNAAPFFTAAHGPFAPYFKMILPDADRLDTLCVEFVDGEDAAITRGPAAAETVTGTAITGTAITGTAITGTAITGTAITGTAITGTAVSNRKKAVIDTTKTLGYWQLFLEDALVGYQLSREQIAERIANLSEEITDLGQSIEQLKDTDAAAANDLLSRQGQLEQLVTRLKTADPLLEMTEIIDRRKMQLNDYLLFPLHRDEILKSVDDENRLEGFVRDGQNRGQVARIVDSLRGQVDTIEKDIQQIRYKHAAEVEGIWRGLEEELNAYGTSLQSPLESEVTVATKVSMDKPFDVNRNSPLYWINLIIPYFDLTVGVLLLLGLFSRLASLAAAGFLAGVILTQPIWVPGYDAKIIYQIVEFGALLVLAATVAGRFGGLDYFLWRIFRPTAELQAEAEANAEIGDLA